LAKLNVVIDHRAYNKEKINFAFVAVFQ